MPEKATRRAVALPLQARGPVEVVGAALGHGVDDAAERAAVFSRVSARLDLHFFDQIDVQILARRPVLQVSRLDAVDDVAVLSGAGAVNGETTEFRFVVGARRLRDERRKVAAVGQQRDLLVADVGLARVLFVSMSGDSAVTDTVSATPPTASASSTVSTWPSRRSTGADLAVVKPEAWR